MKEASQSFLSTFLKNYGPKGFQFRGVPLYLCTVNLHDQRPSPTTAVSELPIHGTIHRQIFVPKLEVIRLVRAGTNERASECYIL